MEQVAYIYSHDGDEYGVKFGVYLCSDDTLQATVRKHIDPDGTDPDFGEFYDALIEAGSYDFEDGWIVIKRGAEIVDFLIYQLREAKSEERFADEQRYKELRARETAEARYVHLRDALIAALGPNAPAVLGAAA